MARRKNKSTGRQQDKFDRALIDSTDLLSDVISDIDFPVPSDDFTVCELARLVQNDNSSFQDEEFWLLLEQGIRLHVDCEIAIRAQLVKRLRHASPKMDQAARRIAPDVIGAIEDIEFPLYRVGAIVRSYTSQLFRKVESLPDTSEAEAAARNLLLQWKNGQLDRAVLLEKLRYIGPDAVSPVADMLFESPNDASATETGLELLSKLESKVSARILAYLVSEPILEEDHEELVRRMLEQHWPTPLPYILYNLKKHTHEDLPYRWFELLIATSHTRGADRILEEVAVHGNVDSFREDLLSILSLLETSKDPGVVGKILRLMTDSRTSESTLRILEDWADDSSLAKSIDAGLDRWNDGRKILVARNEDFNSFASGESERDLEQLQQDWNYAYHENLGWQQRGRFPRGPVETEFEHQLQDTMIREVSLNPTLEEAELRAQIEVFREDWLTTPRAGVIPLVAIYLERPRNTPWMEEIYWCDINELYITAAQFFDNGIRSKARQYLDIVLQIEADYPFAKVLREVLSAE